MIEQLGLQPALSILKDDFKDARRVYQREQSRYDLSDLKPVLVRQGEVLIFPLQIGECVYYWFDTAHDPRYNKNILYLNRGYRPFEYTSVTHVFVITPEEWLTACRKN